MNEKKSETFLDDRISVLEINSVWFGVDILKSIEVIPYPAVTPVPNTKDFIIGVFNLRGDIYSLVDVSTILDLKSKPIEETDMVVLLESNSTRLGILADRVHGVLNLRDSQVKPARGIVSKKMREYITGIISEKSSEIYLLDIDRLFVSREIRTYF